MPVTLDQMLRPVIDAVLAVEDRQGRVLIEHSPSPRHVFSAQTACRATEILARNVHSGTGTRARLTRRGDRGGDRP